MGQDVRTRGGGERAGICWRFFQFVSGRAEDCLGRIERQIHRIIRHDVELLASLITWSSGAVNRDYKERFLDSSTKINKHRFNYPNFSFRFS